MQFPEIAGAELKVCSSKGSSAQYPWQPAEHNLLTLHECHMNLLIQFKGIISDSRHGREMINIIRILQVPVLFISPGGEYKLLPDNTPVPHKS